MTKKTFKLSGLHCVSCSLVIEGELEDRLGVKADCNWAKQKVEVEFDSQRIADDNIIDVIQGQGYKVVGRD